MITQCQECNVIFSACNKKYQTAQIFCKLLDLTINLVYLCDVYQCDFFIVILCACNMFMKSLFPKCYTAHPHAINDHLMVTSEDICSKKIVCRSNEKIFMCKKLNFNFKTLNSTNQNNRVNRIKLAGGKY